MMKVPECWRKSTRSGQDANCVELGSNGAVRDSKNPKSGALRVQLSDFLAAVKTDRLTR